MHTSTLVLLLVTVVHGALQKSDRQQEVQQASVIPGHFCVPDIVMPSSCQGRRTLQPKEMNESTQHSARVEVESEDLTIILFTRKTSGSPKEIIVGDIPTFDKSTFNIFSKTKIILHGYFSSAKYFEHIVYSYLTAEDYNVIMVDWSALSKWCYCEYVLYRIDGVGQQVARLLDFLVQQGVKLKDIHLIGHSLGCHIAGIASRSSSNGLVGRITALDPARPGFELAGQVDRLDRKAADFVDVIHTCAEVMGIEDPIGHADFYPNSGKSPQPGCDGITKELCSHSRAHYLFAESITTDVGFVAQQCDSWTRFQEGSCSNNTARMGDRVDQSTARGMYFLQTGSMCPFYVMVDNTATPKKMSLALLSLSAVLVMLCTLFR